MSDEVASSFSPVPCHASRMSFGLVGVRERAPMINGQARVEGAPGHGTTVEVDIPFQHQLESTS